MEVDGVIRSIIYKSKDSDYTVAILESNDETYTIVGNMPILNIGDSIKVKGNIETHKTYGEQIKVSSYERVLPKDNTGIIGYLSNSEVKGIGIKIAQRIVENFNENTIDVIRYKPEKLLSVKGVNEEKAYALQTYFNEQWDMWNLVSFLSQYGLNISFANKIYKVLGNDSINIIKENPYRILDIVTGTDFSEIDKIASNMGIDENDENRVMAGIIYLIKKTTDIGHTCVLKYDLVQNARTYINVSEEMIQNGIYRLIEDKKVYVEEIDCEEYIYRYSLHKAEQTIADKVSKLNLKELEIISDEEKIKKLGDKFNIELSNEQLKAICRGLNNNITIITGGPGTGKTTIIKLIIEFLKKKKLTYVLCAPTGRAAKRITQTTGEEAKTLHRLLEITKIEDNDIDTVVDYNTKAIEADFVIIDEMSMVDILLMNNTMKSISDESKVILVGDVDQLPSVGPGSVLKDMITSKMVDTVKLTQIYRQGENSNIVLFAHKVNNGEYLELTNKDTDFYFVKSNTVKNVIDEIVSLLTYRIGSFIEVDNVKEIQVLTPLKKGELGTKNLNRILQEVLNPKSNRKKEKIYGKNIFRQGDKIMQMKNNYDISWELNSEIGMGVYNGDIGYIKDIDNENECLLVEFEDGKKAYYFFNELEQLELAYAITIHKSQGSEFKCVVMPIFAGPPKLFTRNLLYTAITRARDMLLLVGSDNALCKMIDSVEYKARNTGLKSKIVKNIDK